MVLFSFRALGPTREEERKRRKIADDNGVGGSYRLFGTNGARRE